MAGRLRRCAPAIVLIAGLGTAAPVGVPAQTPAPPKVLTVEIRDAGGGAVDATGWGRVTSEPAGIDCPTTCSAAFPRGARVRLVQTPSPGYELASWNVSLNDASTCNAPPDCVLTIDAHDFDPTVSAEFRPAEELGVVPAGPGKVVIAPAQPGHGALCEVADPPQSEPSLPADCIQRFTTGTFVTLTAVPDPVPGVRFDGWSDYRCKGRVPQCRVPVTTDMYVTARFSPVTLTISAGSFGAVSVAPPPGGVCPLTGDAPQCRIQLPINTRVTVRRTLAPLGQFWVGACDGNTAGELAADVCSMRLQGNELLLAGGLAGSIPPPIKSSIQIVLAGKGKGTVTGTVLNSGVRLKCPKQCAISGLTRNDRVRLVAKPTNRRSRFTGFSDGYTSSRTHTVQLSRITTIKVTFAKRRR